MFKSIKVATVTVGFLTLVGIVALGAPATANAATNSPTGVVTATSSTACGYDGYQGSQPYYRHCGRGGVVIVADHFFWQHTYACMPPGRWVIPQGDSSWSIIGAEYDGHTCATNMPVSVEGP